MFRALVLGAVQGLTEFIPISSDGHLLLVPFVLAWELPGLAFTVAVHLGTALALLIYFRRDIAAILAGTLRTAGRRGNEEDLQHARLAGLLALGTIPAGLAGILLQKQFESLFDEPQAAAAFLLATAAIILIGEWLHGRRRAADLPQRDIASMRPLDALVVGSMQIIAILPGLSRSGGTISAGMALGLSREDSARFSFLLGIPAIVGAGILKIGDISEGDPAQTIAAIGVSFVTGLAAIAFLLRHLRTRTMRPFAVYCVLASLFAFAYYLQVK